MKMQTRDIGLDVKKPEKECSDIKCPWHSSIAVRGKLFQGMVTSAKMKNSAVVEWGFDQFIPKYERYERRNTRITVHNPPCISAKEGDTVTVVETRPLSKTKSFVIVEIVDVKHH
jgi:small subunit ribosomal protein S17